MDIIAYMKENVKNCRSDLVGGASKSKTPAKERSIPHRGAWSVAIRCRLRGYSFFVAPHRNRRIVVCLRLRTLGLAHSLLVACRHCRQAGLKNGVLLATMLSRCTFYQSLSWLAENMACLHFWKSRQMDWANLYNRSPSGLAMVF